MSLSKESADAFRQCLRILAPFRTPNERRQMVLNVETYIAKGKWIPVFRLAEIALLFYPNNQQHEHAMKLQMLAAMESGELQSSIPEEKGFFASDLSAWPDCPPVPHNSPLRYWLPDWMSDTTPIVSQSLNSPPMKPVQRAVAQDAAILSAITEAGYNALTLPANEPGKPGVKFAIRKAINGNPLFIGATVFDRAWERLRKSGDIADKD